MVNSLANLRALLVDTFWGVVVASDPAPLGFLSLSQACKVLGISNAKTAYAIGESGSRPAIFLTNTTAKQVQQAAKLANSPFWVTPIKSFHFGDFHKTDLSSLKVGSSEEFEDSYFLVCLGSPLNINWTFDEGANARGSGAFQIEWED